MTKQEMLQSHPARLLGIREVATLAGVSTRTIRRYHDRRLMPSPCRLAGLSLLKWKQSDIVGWIDEQANC